MEAVHDVRIDIIIIVCITSSLTFCLGTIVQRCSAGIGVPGYVTSSTHTLRHAHASK